MEKIVKVAFYNPTPNHEKCKLKYFYDCIIKYWQKFRGDKFYQYTHTEIIIDGIWYSSSNRDRGVRKKIITGKSEKWTIIPVKVNHKEKIKKFLEGNVGKKYDWIGIFFYQFIPLKKENPQRYFCSELVAKSLKIGHPVSLRIWGNLKKHDSSYFSPSRLFSLIKKRKFYEYK